MVEYLFDGINSAGTIGKADVSQYQFGTERLGCGNGFFVRARSADAAMPCVLNNGPDVHRNNGFILDHQYF